jgi:hypothetical protein
MKLIDLDFSVKNGDYYLLAADTPDGVKFYQGDGIRVNTIWGNNIRTALIFRDREDAHIKLKVSWGSSPGKPHVKFVKDYMSLAYIIKQIHEGPNIKISQNWVLTNDIVSAEGVFTDHKKAEEYLQKMKADHIYYYQTRMVQTSRLTLPTENVEKFAVEL